MKSTARYFQAALETACRGGVCWDVDLAKVSRWRVGGRADCIVSPSCASEMIAVLAVLNDAQLPFVVLGSSTNLLFADEGLRAIGVHIGPRMSRLVVDGNNVYCEAGHFVPAFARRVAQAGLSGAEHVAGIPGTLGGLVCMNGGSMRRGIGEHVVSVESVCPNGELRERASDQCRFAYRSSIFQENGEIILGAKFAFPDTDCPREIRSRMLRILNDRRKKFPQKLPNCGSVFVSDPSMYADYGPPGAVIERYGLKGRSCGGAQISPLHANFIVNNGGATAAEVISLVALAKGTVAKETGYEMRVEAKYVRPDGSIAAIC